MNPKIKKLFPKVTADSIFELRGRIINGDKAAKKEMAALYVKVLPHNTFLAQELSEQNMKTMYLHLEQVFR